MENISLHGYVRITPSDTEMHEEHRWEQTEGPDQRKCPTLPICPTLPFPHCVRKSISSLHLHLHSCPKTDSSVPFFQIPHTRVSMHLFFSFWLTSLCMMCDPAIPLRDIYPETTVIHKDTCTPVFTAALFIIARTWTQPKCPLTDEWIKKTWYMYTMEYYSAIKGTTLDHL